MTTRKPASSERTTSRRKPAQKLTIWEKIEARGKRIPPEELANFPTDGARNLHHYLHGAPRQDPD